MHLLDNIRKDQLQARKDRDTIKATLLTTLIGEAAMVGKNDGDRETTDAEVIAVIKKFIKNGEETYFAMRDPEATRQIVERLQKEKEILELYLPKQLSAEELEIFFTEIVERNETGSVNVGTLMKVLKETLAGQYDGKLASQIAKKVLG